MLKGRNARSIHCNVLSFISAFNCCLQPAQYPNLELSHTLLKAPELQRALHRQQGRQAGPPAPAHPIPGEKGQGALRMFRLWDKRPEGPHASNEKTEEPRRRLSQKGTETPAAPRDRARGALPPALPAGGGGGSTAPSSSSSSASLPPAAPQGKAGSGSAPGQSGGDGRRVVLASPRF